LLLILVIIGLALANIYFSDVVKRDADTTNAAVNQSSIVQRISKDLFVIVSQYQKVLPYDKEKLELKATMDDFDTALKAITKGGVIESVNNDTGEITKLKIASVKGEEATEILNRANMIWNGYKDNVYPIFEEEENTQSELVTATDYAEENNLELTGLMERLALIAKEDSDAQSNISKIVQYIGIGLASLVFMFTVFRTIKNLRENDDALDKAQEETTGILNTVKEGLFLLDNDLVISSQYSNEMEQIFETKDISGRGFKSLVQDMVSENDSQTVAEFVKLLFDPEKIESLISSLNPLEEIKVTLKDANGDYKTKYLSFNFYRVLSRGEIRDVLVSVRDISDQILLQQQLESTKEQGEQQVEMLVSFLHADPLALSRFLIDSRESLEGINDVLKEPVSGKMDFKNKVDKMFIAVHRMKGEAGSMNFDAFAEKAHEFESELADLRGARNIEGMDFLPLTVRLDKLLSYTDTLTELSNRLTHRGGAVDASTTTASANAASVKSLVEQWSHLPDLVEKVAADSGKKVNLVMSGLAEVELSEKNKEFVNDISIQLLRNSVIHGIEDTETRLARSKSETGRIDLRVAKLSDGTVELIVRDDGQGMNLEKIKNKLIDQGLATKKAVDTWNESRVVAAAFSTGFSTADETTIHAGRGVGLDVIRESVKNMNGKLKLSQMAGKFCQFEVRLPSKAS